MADISLLARVLNGVVRNVDISQNTLVVTSIKVGSVSPTELTKTILDRLVSLQNGTDVDASYHTHDGRYYTESELAATTDGNSGASKIGIDVTPAFTNFTPTANNVQGALEGIDSALASAGNERLDSLFRIVDNGDITKKIAFEASGISTATTRTITMPDANVNLGLVLTAIQRDGSVAFTANQPMGGFKLTGLGAGSTAGDSVRYEQAILTSGANAFAANQSFGGFKATNLADPTAAQDAATKAYVDALAAGLKPKEAARVSTQGNVNLANALENGDVIDGITLATGDRVLVRAQTLPEANGIYVVQASGAAVRAADFDSLTPIDEINRAWVPVQEGSDAGKVFVQYGIVATLGTDPINFTFYDPIAALVGGDMITKTGSTFSVDLHATSGLESSNPGNIGGQLRVKLQASNPSLFITGSNELGVKLDAAGAILSGASGLAVQVDNSSIEINTNALRIKALGVTLAHLASNSVDENKIVSTTFSATGAITGGSGTKVAWNPDGTSLEINANAARIKSTAYDQATITGGSGSAAAVAYAPAAKKIMVAGESFAANTSFLVRWAVSGETAGRVYKADKDASVSDKFWCVGIAHSTGAVSAGQNILVSVLGSHALGSSDTPFGGTDIGKAVFLTAAGAFSITAPSAASEAAFKIGMVETTTSIWVDKQMMGVN